MPESGVLRYTRGVMIYTVYFKTVPNKKYTG